MRIIRLQNNMKLVGVKNFKEDRQNIDYFLVTPGNERLYAFSGKYTNKAYDLCKSKVRVNDLAGRRSRDRDIMNLVKQLNRMLPYLAEYYELPVAA